MLCDSANPALASGNPNVALSAAMLASHRMAQAAPAATAIPFTAAMVIFRQLFNTSNQELSAISANRRGSGSVIRSNTDLRSPPVENARPVPVKTIVSIESSASARRIVSLISLYSSAAESVELLWSIELNPRDAVLNCVQQLVVAGLGRWLAHLAPVMSGRS